MQGMKTPNIAQGDMTGIINK